VGSILKIIFNTREAEAQKEDHLNPGVQGQPGQYGETQPQNK
jgi:hypothetical protein